MKKRQKSFILFFLFVCFYSKCNYTFSALFPIFI